jgi:Meckel syndrome type 1 protein
MILAKVRTMSAVSTILPASPAASLLGIGAPAGQPAGNHGFALLFADVAGAVSATAVSAPVMAVQAPASLGEQAVAAPPLAATAGMTLMALGSNDRQSDAGAGSPVPPLMDDDEAAPVPTVQPPAIALAAAVAKTVTAPKMATPLPSRSSPPRARLLASPAPDPAAGPVPQATDSSASLPSHPDDEASGNEPDDQPAVQPPPSAAAPGPVAIPDPQPMLLVEPVASAPAGPEAPVADHARPPALPPSPPSGIAASAPQASAAAATRTAAAPQQPGPVPATMSDVLAAADAPPAASPLPPPADPDVMGKVDTPRAMSVSAAPPLGEAQPRAAIAAPATPSRFASTRTPLTALPAQPAADTRPALSPPAPAAQAFAAAIEAADRQDRQAARGAADPATAVATAIQETAPVAAAAGAGGDQPSLDMRQQGWPAAMVDHIERLRDAADATSTRIRVVPDALGSIDVTVRRHDDGAVQLSLAADRPATQALIADARPELTRLADERGTRVEISLAAPGASGGAAGSGSSAGFADGRTAQQQQQPAQRRAPASAATTLSDDPERDADRRVA